MSKVNKKNQESDVHSHIEQAYGFLDLYLPTQYVKSVQDKFGTDGKSKPSSSLIRNVRNRTNLRNDILLVLVEVAKENKDVSERITFLTT